MKKLLNFLNPILDFNIKHPFLVLFFGFLLSVIGAYFAIQLKVDTDIANLLPEDNPNVVALTELQEAVGGETEMQVVIQSPSFEANLKFANDLIPRTLDLFYERYNDTYFERAEFRKETEFTRNNALYLASTTELENITQWLQDEIRDAKEEANPFFFDLFEDEEEEMEEENPTEEFEESYNVLVPSEYPISEDSTIMVIKFYPTGSKSDLRYLEDMFIAYEELLAEMNPSSYHPAMEVNYGGRLKRHLEEITSIMNDVIGSFATGISSVILLVMLYFFIKKYIHARKGGSGHSVWSHVIRIPVPVLIIGIPLIFSLLWTFGITYFYLGMLNTMTSVLFVILFGLGIDYGIHYYARYIELRSSGLGVREAIFETSDKTGEAILVSAFTTAAALYILMFADFRGFSEFGFISGTGILLALLAMLYLLPSLLVIFEKFNWILLNPAEEKLSVSEHRYPYSKTILFGGILISVIVIAFSPNMKFEYNFANLEPKFPEYERFARLASQVESSDKRNPAYVIADNNEDVLLLMDTLNEYAQKDTLSPTILSVESLQERFPSSQEEENSKLESIAKIRELLQDPLIVSREDEGLEKLRQGSQTRSPLKIDEIPEYLKSRFVTTDGELGKFVIIYPSVGLSDGLQSIAFKDDVGAIELENGKTYHAASTSIVAASMLDLMRTESPYMVGATFLFIYLFMLFSFRSFRWSLISMLPLLVGLLWLFGIMMIFGLQFNFYNLVVLPAILGIGEDSGVHLAHRYRSEGKNSMWAVLSSTGQHITVGSLTTMLGFAGLLFTNHPGLQSLGIMATIGIGMTLLTSVTFLPALIQFLEDRDWIKF